MHVQSDEGVRSASVVEQAFGPALKLLTLIWTSAPEVTDSAAFERPT